VINLELPHVDDAPAAAALAYVARGCAVFPLDGKHPIAELAPHGFKSASTDPARVASWWSARPDANIGLALATGTVVLDEDPRHNGHLSREALEHQHGPLPFTLRAITGSGGFHWIFRAPAGVELVQRSIAPGLDTRIGGKGYIVAAPSLHASGERYRWLVGIAPLPAPAWLVDALRVPAQPERRSFVPVVAGTLRATRRERFARGSLAGMARKVAEMGESNRNEILNWAWHKAGGFADVVPKSEARAALLEAAMACGLPEREALKVLR